MLRGIQKRMIVCKPPIGSRFEAAYFVLRENADAHTEDKGALMRDIERMLKEGDRQKSTPASASQALRRALALFFGGMACGILPFALLYIFS